TIQLGEFAASDFDTKLPEAATSGARKPSESTLTPGVWDFKFQPMQLRHVRLMVQEYRGDSVAINHIEVKNTADKKASIPTDADLHRLANNDILEIAPGDTITASYVDEVPEPLAGQSRLLTAQLTATYFNASIGAIAYDFVRREDGEVTATRKQL